MDAAESIRRSLNSRQRQCSDKVIARTTPSLLGLFSLVTLLAHHLHFQSPLKARQAVWYSKSLPTFSDAMALVRSSLWSVTFSTSPEPTQMAKVPRLMLERMTDTLVWGRSLSRIRWHYRSQDHRASAGFFDHKKRDIFTPKTITFSQVVVSIGAGNAHLSLWVSNNGSKAVKARCSQWLSHDLRSPTV